VPAGGQGGLVEGAFREDRAGGSIHAEGELPEVEETVAEEDLHAQVTESPSVEAETETPPVVEAEPPVEPEALPAEDESPQALTDEE